MSDWRKTVYFTSAVKFGIIPNLHPPIKWQPAFSIVTFDITPILDLKRPQIGKSVTQKCCFFLCYRVHGVEACKGAAHITRFVKCTGHQIRKRRLHASLLRVSTSRVVELYDTWKSMARIKSAFKCTAFIKAVISTSGKRLFLPSYVLVSAALLVCCYC